MPDKLFDAAIIGAGAAGLMAAWELALAGKKVLLIEAKDHIGGRAFTLDDGQFESSIESGAEFIHGDLELTLLLLKKAGLSYYKVTGEIWQKEEGRFDEQKDFIEDATSLNEQFNKVKEDMSVARFIEHYLQDEKYQELRESLKNYVEGYYAADLSKASLLSLKDEWQHSDDVQYRIEGGYTVLIHYLKEKCMECGVELMLSSPVSIIEWDTQMVSLTINKRKIAAKKVLVTVSLGMLQEEQISFVPQLPELTKAATQLGFGPVIKIILQFEDRFWIKEAYTSGQDMEKLGFIFSDKRVPTWWTQFPKKYALLTGWLGGPHADEHKDLSDEEIVNSALLSLSDLFNIDIVHLKQKLKAAKVFNWVKDPYCRGGYAYQSVNASQHRAVLKETLTGNIYFAGEALVEGPEIGTVEAALKSGQETARKMITYW